MAKSLLILLLIILLPPKYEGTSSPEPTTGNSPLVSEARLSNEKERKTSRVSGKNYEGIREVHLGNVYRKGKGVYGGGDMIRPHSGTGSTSSPRLVKSSFHFAPLALYLLLWLE